MMKKGIMLLILAILLLVICFIIPVLHYNIAELVLIASFVLLCIAMYRLFIYKNEACLLLYIPLFLAYFYINTIIQNNGLEEIYPEHFKVISTVYYRTHNNTGYDIRVFFVENGKKHEFWVWGSQDGYYSIKEGSMVLFERDKARSSINKYVPSSFDIEYFSKAVYYSDAGEEFGNDYYYYAKLRPDLALKNFGLNKLAIGKDNILYYKNVNDSIDSQAHRCADSLQSQLNRDIVDTAEAFYFHGEIIPAEKVFAEIPQTRAYYETYCGKLE